VVVRRSALQRSGDKNAPQALLKPICVQYGRLFRRKMPFVSSAAGRPERGLSRGNLSPLTLFWFLLQEQKERPGGEPYRLCTLQNLRDAFRRPPILP